MMWKRSLAMLSIFFVAACSAACSEDSTGPNNENGDFEITVGSGTRPTYSWSVGPAFSVSVVRTSAPGTIVWGIAAPAQNIGSPATHGTVPGGTAESASTERTLTAGTEYRVSVTLGDGRTGWKEFRP